jgi:hypothetical protein
MQTLSKHLLRSLKINAEPEQLDLFGEHPSSESTGNTGHPLSQALCLPIAMRACLCHRLSVEHVDRLRALLTHHCSHEPASSVVYDYVVGLASTMSLWPTPMQETFSHSDRAALFSDWATVQSDLNEVWRAVTLAERDCNERSGQKSGWQWRPKTDRAE